MPEDPAADPAQEMLDRTSDQMVTRAQLDAVDEKVDSVDRKVEDAMGVVLFHLTTQREEISQIKNALGVQVDGEVPDLTGAGTHPEVTEERLREIVRSELRPIVTEVVAMLAGDPDAVTAGASAADDGAEDTGSGDAGSGDRGDTGTGRPDGGVRGATSGR